MAALTQATASYVIDETVSVLAFDEFTQANPQMPVLYGMRGSSKPDEDHASMSALGDFQIKTPLAEPTEDTPTKQFRKQVVHEEYALQVKVERKVIDDSLFNFFGQLGQKIGQSAIRTFESHASDVFNNAFGSQTAEDALALCHSAHVNVDSANSQSNTGTDELTHANVISTRTSMRNFTDYDGNKVSVVPDLLLVPNALEDDAFAITKSTLDPSSGNNAINFNNGRYGTVVWDYLSDANNWFLIDSRMMKQNLIWYWRMPLEIYGDGDLMAGKRSVGGYFRSANDVFDWRWVFGQNAA